MFGSKLDSNRLRSRSVALTSFLGLAVALAQLAHAQVLTTLYNFTGSADGSAPLSGLVSDRGNLYGTAGWGGIQGANCQTNNGYGTGCGTVFELKPSKGGWIFRVLHSFTGGRDGSAPFGTLATDRKGNLFGTASWGGTQNASCNYNVGYGVGCGSVFKLTPSPKGWSFSVLHRFGGIPDGANPDFESLVFDAEGNAYGTTEFGGNCCNAGGGTVFKITTDRRESVVYRFEGGSADGSLPYGGLVLDHQGSLYGTTYWSGAAGWGTIFQVTEAGTESVLHSFTAGADGGFPYAGLVWGDNNVLYGTTSYGGSTANGTVFQVTADGSETILHSFCSSSGCADGRSPYGALIRDANGNLYGTTFIGGVYGYGVVFKLSSTGGQWSETVLHSFDYDSDGAWPYSRLLMRKNVLYGTTAGGGSNGHGTVFALTLSSRK
jgi:uncharacterized repeat protein (TIGR03803 family)